MARAADADIADQIKNCFREFDRDRNGAITKGELTKVLQKLCRPGQTLSKEEIDQCMEDADKNGNGVIEYEEFVDWLMKPGSRVQASREGAALFDFEAVIRPLFDAFDRNGDSAISAEEFQESFLILQNAMLMCSKGGKHKQPAMLEADSSELFKTVGGQERGIDFKEFVQWQRKALEKSGLLNEDLRDLVPALARQLQRIFKLSEAQEKGELNEQDTSVLTRIIDNINAFTSSIWNEEYAAKNALHGKKHYTNRWSEPPVGLNVDRLMRRHLKESTLKIRDASSCDLQVYCLPEKLEENQEDLSKRRWIARISQGYNQKSQERPSEENFRYYVYTDLAWRREGGGAEIFNEAMESFPPDMRFYCLLKTQANFGVNLTWDMVQTSLKNAVAFGLVTAEAHEKYNEVMEAQVMQSLREEGLLTGLSPEERTEKLRDTLRNNFKLGTRSVMALLLELEVFRISSKLADLLGS